MFKHLLISFTNLAMSELLTSQTCLGIVCNQSCDDLSPLADHEKNQAKERPLKHHYSDKTYITVITCKEHKRSQAVIMPFNCPDCFRAKSCFTMHKRVHCELHSSPYFDKTFRVMEAWKMHISTPKGSQVLINVPFAISVSNRCKILKLPRNYMMELTDLIFVHCAQRTLNPSVYGRNMLRITLPRSVSSVHTVI